MLMIDAGMMVNEVSSGQPPANYLRKGRSIAAASHFRQGRRRVGAGAAAAIVVAGFSGCSMAHRSTGGSM
jgi:hypothetical protein